MRQPLPQVGDGLGERGRGPQVQLLLWRLWVDVSVDVWLQGGVVSVLAADCIHRRERGLQRGLGRGVVGESTVAGSGRARRKTGRPARRGGHDYPEGLPRSEAKQARRSQPLAAPRDKRLVAMPCLAIAGRAEAAGLASTGCRGWIAGGGGLNPSRSRGRPACSGQGLVRPLYSRRGLSSARAA